MLANYEYERNEIQLMNLLGFSKIKNRKVEREFLNKLVSQNLLKHHDFKLESWQKPTVIIIQGGFCDAKSAFCYRICSFLKENFAKQYGAGEIYIFYREHDEYDDSLNLANYFNQENCKVILIGHSWGGSSACLQVAAKLDKNIKLLVSLDPVGIFRPTKRNRYRPKADYWLNIYVDYKLADYGFRNNVARVGRPWEYNALADKNISSEILEHENAKGLFIKYGLEQVEKIVLSQESSV